MNKEWAKQIENFRYYLTLERSFSNNTVESYLMDCQKLVTFLNNKYPNVSPKEVDIQILNEFVGQLEKKEGKDEEERLLRSSTQTRIIQGIRALFKFLMLTDVIERNPSEHIITPYIDKKIPEILERSEIQRMMKAIDVSTAYGFRNRLTIELLYSTGMRVSEFINLKLSDIHYTEEYLDIIGKGNKERYIPIDARVLADLKLYIDQYRVHQKQVGEYTDFVFLSEKRGTKLTRQFIFSMLKKTAEMAGIDKKVHPHILRHSFATELIRGGANILAVKEIMGHSSITSTEVYVNLNILDIKKTLYNYHPFFQK
ncbi:MAG: tyrosine-type recombinase/integrase [Bacteroidota bacterium]|nr:tyrosine-type recombinase/integrase [Bacteroidota bacterium]